MLYPCRMIIIPSLIELCTHARADWAGASVSNGAIAFPRPPAQFDKQLAYLQLKHGASLATLSSTAVQSAFPSQCACVARPQVAVIFRGVLNVRTAKLIYAEQLARYMYVQCIHISHPKGDKKREDKAFFVSAHERQNAVDVNRRPLLGGARSRSPNYSPSKNIRPARCGWCSASAWVSPVSLVVSL